MQPLVAVELMIVNYDDIFTRVTRAESLPKRKLSKRLPIKKVHHMIDSMPSFIQIL